MLSYPCCKINLGLNVVAKRPDGYHDLETVFMAVPVTDVLEVEITQEGLITQGGLSLLCKNEELSGCDPEKNLVMRAYRLLEKDFKLPAVSITLTKQIPSQAGMGGGSSDGAFMITMLNELCNLHLTEQQMEQYAARLGADCAFFINPEQPRYATGIGEILSDFDDSLLMQQLKGKHLLLIKPDVAVSTKEAYAGITPKKPRYNCREVIETLPMKEWKDKLTNDFEDSIFPKLPVLREVKEQMYEDGAVYAAMSGSGSTLFAFYEQEPIKTIERYANKYYTKSITL